MASEKYAVPIPPFSDGPRISYVAMQTRANWCPQDSSIGRLGNTQSSVITSGSKRRRSPSEVWGMELFGPLARYDLKPFVSWRGADTQMQIAPRAVDLEVPPSEIAPAIFR